MDGALDAPESEPSRNAIEMLNQAQAPFIVVDLLIHVAFCGCTALKSDRRCLPHLYANGIFAAGYERIMTMYQTGELAKSFGASQNSRLLHSLINTLEMVTRCTSRTQQ